MEDLEQIITDSVNDSVNDVESPEAEVFDASPDPVESVESDSSAEPVAEADPSLEVSSPANQTPSEVTPEAVQDEFAKMIGMPQVGVGGRENRIPYSRVKKITEKAAAEAESKVAEVVLGRKLNPGEKAVDVVKSYVAQLPELQSRVGQYEERLQNVGQFENIMENDPEKFLGMLSKLPKYKEFFDFVSQAASGTAPESAPIADPNGDMPQPDETLTDGSTVYSMEGIKNLLAWNAAQTETRVTSKYEARLKEIESRYAPVAQDWQERRRIEAALPVIRKQLETARTWPLFNESEAEILAALEADKDRKLTLEGAYNKVVFPKLVADRDKVRQQVLAELKAAPTSTSVTSRTASKPAATSDGPRSLEDVIKQQIATLK